MWKKTSGLKLCSYIIMQSEAQTSKWSSKKQNTFLTGGELILLYTQYYNVILYVF